MSTELGITLIVVSSVIFNGSYLYTWAMASSHYEGSRLEVLWQAMVFHPGKFKPEGLVYRRRMIYHQLFIVIVFLGYGALAP